QYGADHARQAEEVDLEHPADLRLVALLDRGEVADPGVVHQHVDAAEVLLGAPHRLGDLARIGHVELQDQPAVPVPGDEIFDLMRIAGRHHGRVAAGHHRPGQLTAEPG